MKKSLLDAIALGVGGSAISGFGGAAGRDIYKSVKRSTGLIIALISIAAAVSLPFIGMRNLFRGRAPGEEWKAIGDILLVLAGIVIGIGVGLFAGITMGQDVSAMSLITIVGAGIMAGVIGALAGVISRPGAQRRYRIATRNQEFLDTHGIHESGGTEITHYDVNGNALRLFERTVNSIVFMVVGKRNKRAYITLTKNGEMIDYSGVVSLGAGRDQENAAA